MKTLVLLALTFLTLHVTAQNKDRIPVKQHKIKEVKRTKIKQHNFSAEERAEIQSKRMTLQLDLNNKQQNQVKAAILRQIKSRQELAEETKNKKTLAKREKLTKEEKLKRINKRLDNQIAMKSKMKSILNAEQYEKWQKNLARKKRPIAISYRQ